MASISAVEEELENAEQQRTELETLQSIYTNEELTVLKDNAEYLVCHKLDEYDSVTAKNCTQFLTCFR